MPLTDLALHLVALLVYPGALLAIAVGAVVELAGVLATGRGGLRAAAAAQLGWLRPRSRTAAPVGITAALLALLASTQVAIPFNPVSPVERNLLAAAIALAGVAWLGWALSWDSPAGPRLTLVAQGCWLVALLAPAVLAQSLRPQALGAIVVPAQMPLKVVAALLYLLCLPVVLQLLPRLVPNADLARGRAVARAPAPVSLARLLSWLPTCGLFASVYFPPAADDLLGVLRFLGTCLAAAAAVVALAGFLSTRSETAVRALYLHVAPPLAAFVLTVAAATAVLT